MSNLSDLVEGTPEWYRKAWELCEFDKGYEGVIKHDAIVVASHKVRYQKIEAELGVPWFVIGAIHFKESTCDFRGCLANGQKIIGTGRKTTIVPEGRGPYATWEESAIDALKLMRFDRVKNWEIGNLLFLFERYNGTGYIRGKGAAETSPYLWARTSVNDDFGKYVKDRVFDPKAPTNKTSGICAILKYLEKQGHIQIQYLKAA